MEKFRTHAGPKSFDDIVSEIMKKPKPPEGVYAAKTRDYKPLIDPVEENATVSFGPDDFGRRYEFMDSAKMSFADFQQEYNATFNTATGPVGPTGPYPSTPGANGPAGPLVGPMPTAPASSGVLPGRDRAEVDLRQAIRRCLKENVPLDRMVEIFRLELIDVVHDE